MLKDALIAIKYTFLLKKNLVKMTTESEKKAVLEVETLFRLEIKCNIFKC